MTPPEDSESRLRDLERKQAVLEQSLRDVIDDVRTMTPVRESVTRIEEQLKQVGRDLTGLRKSLADDRENAARRSNELEGQIAAMRKESSDQARDNKRQLIAATAAIIAAMAGSVITAVAAHL